MRDVEKRLRRLEQHFARVSTGFTVTLVCMDCGFAMTDGDHVCLTGDEWRAAMAAVDGKTLPRIVLEL